MSWTLDPAYAALEADFGNLERVFTLQGERLTSSPLSEVIRLERDGIRYYVKRYWAAGKGLRRYIGRPRVKAEWQNLQRFQQWGIATAPLVAWGMEYAGGAFRRGAMITREIENSTDMGTMAKRADPRLADPAWVECISRQLARATRIMHEHRFAHNDLKWRNLLVNPAAELFMIDCPTGAFWFGPFLRRRIIKDLACLDKVAKYRLSRTQRLRFYLHYQRRTRTQPADRKKIRQVLDYFEGRE
ncbi:hypothetical protein FHR87_001128 [Azomonas macrocytogenes]|uniref:Heptose kinase n=2 Tax=Azomonas macrocytogenes TaxID=69962 RepID=A0A839T275_AZOMA|nr:hypothetical protein [Azomonas macrocytogenes]